MKTKKAPRADESALEVLKKEAEAQMRRNLDEHRPTKRAKHNEGKEFVPVDRYHYAMVSELEGGCKGFIVTCNFRREKSATREVSQLLKRYLPAHLFPAPPPAEANAREGGQQGAAPCAGGGEGQGPAQNAEAGGEEQARSGDEGSGSEDEEEGVALAPGGGDGAQPAVPAALGLAKLACRGVVMLRLSAAAAAAVDPVAVVERMLADREAGALQQPVHCQRIIPVDSTCTLTPAGIARTMAQAAAAYGARHAGDGNGEPPAFTYAVVVHSRAPEATAAQPAPQPAAAAAPAPAPAPAAVPGHAGGAAAAGSTVPEGGQEAPVAAPAAAEAGAAAAAGGRAAAAEPGPGEDAGSAPAAASAGGGGGDGGGAQPGQGAVARGAAAAQGPAVAQAADRAAALDRGALIAAVAGGMRAAFGERAKVNLKKPQVAVLVETVPVSGRMFGCVCLLDAHMFHAGGKTHVKPLVKNARA